MSQQTLKQKPDKRLGIPSDHESRAEIETLLSVLEERKWARSHPVEWCEKVLGVRLYSKQRKIIKALASNNQVAVKSSNAVGKSFVSACAACWFLPNFVPSYVITSASSWKGVEKIIWPTVRNLREKAKEDWFKEFGHMYDGSAEWKIANQHGMFGVSTNDAENFAGYRSPGGVLVIFDEASALTNDIYEAIMGLSASGNVKILLIGNPLVPEGPFYQCFQDPSWTTFTISAFDSPNVGNRFRREYGLQATRSNALDEPLPGLATEKWIEQRRKAWGEDSSAYKARVLGEFPEFAEDQIISLLDIQAAIDRNLNVHDEDPVYMGVDPARYGDDDCTIRMLKGRKELAKQTIKNRNSMEVARVVSNLIKKWKVKRCMLDEVGIGSGILDRLHEMGHSDIVSGVNMSRSAKNPSKFANLRCEMWFRMRDWLRDEGDIKDDPKLIGDLTSSKYRIGPGDIYEIERKEKTKKRLGRSPDDGDALILCVMASESLETDWWCN